MFKMKKMIVTLIMLIIIYFTTEWIVRGLHYIVFDSNTYLSFVSPILHWTKYLAVAFILIWLFKKYVPLAHAGKIMISIALILIPLMFVIASLWFNAVKEEKIVKHRIFSHTVNTWEEVEAVSTNIYRKRSTSMGAKNHLTPSKLIVNYNIHLVDGSVIDVWNDLESMYVLHQFVLANNIDVEYLSDVEHFDQKFASYFKDSLDKAHLVFGIK